MAGPGTKRQEAALETRRAILSAAKEMYATEAEAQAPVSRLAARAGVAEGTVFAHFPDKPSLLAAALQDEIDQVLAAAWGGLPGGPPCSERLLHLAGAFYSFYAKRPSLFRLLIKESMFLQGQWGERIAEGVLGFVGRVAELIEQAKAGGEYRREADSLLAAKSFFALYFLELINALHGPAFDPARTLDGLRAAWGQLEDGLRAGKGDVS